MKKISLTLTCLMVSFMVLGCAEAHTESSVKNSSTSSQVSKSSSKESSSSSQPKSSSKTTSSSKSSSSKESSSVPHQHKWSTTWSFNEHGHFHKCTGCEEINDFTAHTMSSEWKSVEGSTLTGEDQYKYSNPKTKSCSLCKYYQLDGTNILPELHFTSNVASEINFATIATKDDLERPEVSGKFTLTNCEDKYKLTDEVGTMKVRGNQTAGWSKKGFRIKFNSKKNLLGLNEGQKYKKWVLFADAKDTTLSRTALGLNAAGGICSDQADLFVSDFTPVTVYLNEQYWGYYYLAEQKEVKEGRITLPESTSTGEDIAYCFELDFYASNEAKKTDGDPTFTVSYKPSEVSYKIENNLANSGSLIKTYTMASDITNKDTQLPFIKKRVESLYTILYEAAVNKKAKTISNNEVVNSTDSIQKVIADNFDLETWVDGFITNAYTCPPDLGYSSFYMSFDNTSAGEKKLRFDNPWDFDSNFGNRDGFITDPGKATSSGWSGSFDPFYMDRTSNMWIQLFSKLDFFITMVKARWNQLREAKVFENNISMVKKIYADYDAEIKRNHLRWPVNDAAEHNTFNELRDLYKKVSNYKNAEAETISWCAKRVNYLESLWGNGRANLPTN